ncbi:hypothetical protein V1523DRAFT_421251 [Lipomyces doorenjongii]
MRSRAISLSAFSPPLFDVVELKVDIMKDGLVCWHMDRMGHDDHPVDLRSWEAAPWFLKKWWKLLSGKDGEAWEQTKWRREFRGEELKI